LLLLSVLATIYKLHPADWWQRLYHGIVSGKKSPQINKNKFSYSDCTVVLANGGLLLTTGNTLLLSRIIMKQDAINSLKYSPKINKNGFSHSDCSSSCQ
jgi:hypothetical protein